MSSRGLPYLQACLGADRKLISKAKGNLMLKEIRVAFVLLEFKMSLHMRKSIFIGNIVETLANRKAPNIPYRTKTNDEGPHDDVANNAT